MFHKKIENHKEQKLVLVDQKTSISQPGTFEMKPIDVEIVLNASI